MSAQPPVFESKATYYNSSTKKWISGTFSLDQTHLRFHADHDQNEQNLVLPLSTISGLERRQSNFIYAALVVTVGPIKHWFASFQNRDAVYNVLELFWKQPLFSKSPSKPKAASSTLGKELLGILQESEYTLVGAANALSNQSRQLQESETVLEDVNTDLTVAQRLLKNMNVLSSLSSQFVSEPKAIETLAEQESRQKHFNVAYTFNKLTGDISCWESGTLVVANNFSLLDERKNKKLIVNFIEVEKLLVLSPWEFCLVYSSGILTKQCHVMCPQLSSLLKFLSSFPSMENKIDYSDNSFSNRASCSAATSRGSTSSLPPLLALDSSSSSGGQIQTEDSVISEEDMTEISNALNNLQALATEVGREQQNQMEKINTLISDVDKTELRIKAHNKEIKKAM